MSEILSRDEFDKAKIDVACDTAVAVSDAQAHGDAFVATIEALEAALSIVIDYPLDDASWHDNDDAVERIAALREKGWLS